MSNVIAHAWSKPDTAHSLFNSPCQCRSQWLCSSNSQPLKNKWNMFYLHEMGMTDIESDNLNQWLLTAFATGFSSYSINLWLSFLKEFPHSTENWAHFFLTTLLHRVLLSSWPQYCPGIVKQRVETQGKLTWDET